VRNWTNNRTKQGAGEGSNKKVIIRRRRRRRRAKRRRTWLAFRGKLREEAGMMEASCNAKEV